jgi:hypothetical protein
MLLFEYPELVFTQIALIVVSVIWFLRRNDEIPLIISSLLFYIASYRYWSVNIGINHWVNLSSYGISRINNENALRVLSYIILGQICLLATYMYQQKRVLPIVVASSDNRPLLQGLGPKAILIGLFCLPVAVITRSSVIQQLHAGHSLAFEVSGYLNLFPLALVGIATLILWLWKLNGLSSIPSKIAAIVILLGVSYLSFNISGRFQFLGWLIAGGIILSSSYRPRNRLIILALIAILGIGIFSLAGAMRYIKISHSDLQQSTLERAVSAEDANMLDGFVFLESIYPQRLDFRYGMEHIEILLRPIPRAWWPEKPVGGGYMKEFGLSNSRKGTTLGFSPTLFGSFYSEGGLLGIGFFSWIYGLIFANVVRYSTRLQPFAGLLIRAIFCACLIPLLRGGDLPGIYAWIGMAFWPCFLLLWLKQANLKLKVSTSRGTYFPGNIPTIGHF